MNSRNMPRSRGLARGRGRRNNVRSRNIRNNAQINRFRRRRYGTRSNIRRFRRNNTIKQTNNINNRNNQKKLNNKIDNKINEIKNQISKLKLIEVKDPKINSTKKEMRKDKLIDASIMAKYSKMLAFYKTPSKIVKYCTYNKYLFHKNNKSAVLWFPYAYPFIWGKSHDHNNNAYASVWSFNVTSKDYYGYHATPIDIVGNYRLVCATLKISNVTSISDREGTYMVVKDVESDFIPMCYSTDNNMNGDQTITGLFAQFMAEAVNKNFSNTTEKQLYSCNDKAKIVEYNVSEGLNIFQGHQEYLGMTCKQDDQVNRFYNQYIPYNPVGQNIKYIMQFDDYSKQQLFCVETWQIFEIRPSSSSSYSSIATIGDQVFNKEVYGQAKGENNFKFEKI